jgi:nucleoside-diphosphate kinase
MTGLSYRLKAFTATALLRLLTRWGGGLIAKASSTGPGHSWPGLASRPVAAYPAAPITPAAAKEPPMAVERTLSIIKPDATRRNLTGKINAKFEDAGLRIVAQKRLQLSEAQAGAFYAVHAARPFYKDLVSFMISGPVVVQVLEGEGAVLKNRDIMGATNPANAAEGTIRKEFAESIEANSVHGSDSAENAATEIAFFFAGTEIVV